MILNEETIQAPCICTIECVVNYRFNSDLRWKENMVRINDA